MTDNTKNFNRIWTLLQAEYPDAGPELHFSNTLQVLVATILSAQCTDAQVNKVTDVLFMKYKSVEDFGIALVPILGFRFFRFLIVIQSSIEITSRPPAIKQEDFSI